MIRNEVFSVIMLAVYVLVYSLLMQLGAAEELAMAMLVLSPMVMGWVVYRVVKFGRYTANEQPLGYTGNEDNLRMQ